jgi:hypothetical protein
MPPRWLSVAIVAFWLATTGWLFYQDVWLWLPSGQPPPYTIALEDEVQQSPVPWTAFYKESPFLHVETAVKFNKEDDTFDLIAKVRPLRDSHGADPSGGVLAITSMKSVYRVTRQGGLRAVSIDFASEAHLGVAVPGQGSLTGQVRDGRFFSHLHASIDATSLFSGQTIDRDLDPVAVSAHGSVLSPLHPVNRIAGLRPGQTWRMPLVDPVADAFASLIPDGTGEILLTAAVRPQPETLTWNGKPVACLVIDYKGGGFTAVTWVQVGSGLVLRQESEHHGEKIALQRD